MAHIVVVGAGLGGVSTAYELRHLLPRAKHTITLVSDQAQFTFTPGLIAVTFGHKSLSDIQLDLRRVVPPKGIEFIQGRATALDPHRQILVAGDCPLLLNVKLLA